MSEHDATSRTDVDTDGGAPTAVLTAEAPAGAGDEPRPGRTRVDLLFWFGAVWLVLIVALALLAPLLPLASVGETVSGPSEPPSWTWPEPLGTDSIGRSVLTRVIFGARISLLVSAAATAMGAVVGGLLGLFAAHVRGKVEAVVDVVTDSVLAFPPLLLLLAMAAVLEPSAWTLTIGLGVLTIPAFTRLMKANALATANREFVLAAQALGAGSGRLVFREVLPNTVAAVLAFGVVQMAVLIVAEGSLSFLGLGVPPPTPSWGGMIASGRDRLGTAPALVFVPGVFFVLTVYSLNTVGERLRARFDTGEGKL